ncbi:hypothetical protein FOF52_09715 [Thermobifida alba]|uniref:Integral membrane protein n=1 Tax=Thermobifida alba TaxID=53522 RepID=A0ABY4L0L4_THEAE|nr:hypothetical protein [Thermobifida alba]UPT21202.1 hypothetical protein FOF52_09715 [Thermobifida alba]
MFNLGHLFSALLVHIPHLLIGLVGLVLTFTVRLRGRGLLASAMVVLLLSTLGNLLFQLLSPSLLAGIAADQVNLVFTLVSVVLSLLDLVIWGLVFAALFANRERVLPTAPAVRHPAP